MLQAMVMDFANKKCIQEADGFTDEQLNDPKFLEESKKIIKKT